MPSIAAAVASLEGDRSTFAAALAYAQAQGVQFDAAADRTRAAQAELDSAIGRARTEKALADAGDARVAAALAARGPALAAAAAARGGGQPLAAASATALKAAVVQANGGDGTKVDTAIANVKALDDEIAALGDIEGSELQTALDDLAAKQAALAVDRTTALALLALIERGGGDLASGLLGATDARDRATALAAAGGDPAHWAAIVAYADYAVLRDTLGAAESNAALTGDWQSARDAWLAAAGDVAAAEEVVIEKRLAWQLKLAERMARLATRPAAAAAKAGEAF